MNNLKLTIISTLVIPFILYILHLPPVSAQSPTPDSLRDSVKQQVAAELAQIKSSISKKAFIGELTGKTDLTFSLKSYFGENKSILISTETTIKLKSGKDGTPADLTTGNYILAMGDVDGAGQMVAKRLLVISAPQVDTRKVVFSTYSELTTSSKVSSATAYTKVADGAVVKAKAADFKSDSKVIAVTKGTTILSLHLLPATP